MAHEILSVPTEARQQAADACFRQAAGRFSQITRRFRIGDQVVRIRFAGKAMAEMLLPAIAHLESESAEFDESAGLTIDVWESERSPLRLPHEDWLTVASPLTAFGIRDFVYLQPDIGMLTMFCGNRAFICFRDADKIPTWELTMPFRVTLNAWFQRSGGQIVHGAAVANDDDAVILAGRGGSGKSSTALSCLATPPLAWMGDDLCLLTGGAQPTVYSLYNSLKLWRDNLPRFDDLPLQTNVHSLRYWDKPTFFLYPEYQHRIARQRPVRAILLPRITHGTHTRVIPATAADAWRALVPSTSTVVIGDQQTGAKNITHILDRLGAYWLELGTDRDGIVSTIEQFLLGTQQIAA